MTQAQIERLQRDYEAGKLDRVKRALYESLVKDGLMPSAQKPLWPKELCTIDAGTAFRFVTQHCRTWDEVAVSADLIPDFDYIRTTVEQWLWAVENGAQLHIVKSRRLVISWLIAALDVWMAGVRGGTYVVTAETYEAINGACGFCWRRKYVYDQIRAHFPSWNLGASHGVGGGGEGQHSQVVLPNGAMFLATNSSSGVFQGAGATAATLEELSQYKNCADIVAQATFVLQGRAGTRGGALISVSNAPEGNDDYMDIIGAKGSEYLLSPKECSVKEVGDSKRVLRIHYGADPGKDAEWVSKSRPNVPARQWEREMEGCTSTYEGEPVFPEFDRMTHVHNCSYPSMASRGVLIMGWDIGTGFNHAAVLLHVRPDGQIQCLSEFYSREPMKLDRFCDLVAQKLTRLLLGWRSMGIRHVCDPAGNARDKTLSTAIQVLARYGFNAKPSTNNIPIRLAAVSWALTDAVSETEEEFVPRFVIDPQCTDIIQGLNGAYVFDKRRNSRGETVYKATPEKNRFSHLQDSLQYALIEAKKFAVKDSDVEVKDRGNIQGQPRSRTRGA